MQTYYDCSNAKRKEAKEIRVWLRLRLSAAMEAGRERPLTGCGSAARPVAVIISLGIDQTVMKQVGDSL